VLAFIAPGEEPIKKGKLNNSQLLKSFVKERAEGLVDVAGIFIRSMSDKVEIANKNPSTFDVGL